MLVFLNSFFPISHPPFFSFFSLILYALMSTHSSQSLNTPVYMNRRTTQDASVDLEMNERRKTTRSMSIHDLLDNPLPASHDRVYPSTLHRPSNDTVYQEHKTENDLRR
ncbi:hypothetical protein BDB01DRAFT_808447 [Pilobolus umbonatus]|nr:hypothetical protein BDB01DRAFT_808447 [Pilobolus umbonatus]